MIISKSNYIAATFLLIAITITFYVYRSSITSQTGRQNNDQEITQRQISLETYASNPFRIDELKTLLQQYFASDYSNSATHMAALLDSKNYDNLIRINYLLSLAIDLGANLEELEIYGLESLENGNYSIDNRTHPGWQTLDSHLIVLRIEGFVETVAAQDLMQNGFSQEGLSALISYLNNTDPELEASRAALDILEEEISFIQVMQLNPADRQQYAQIARRINEKAYFVNSQVLKDWAINLMNQLNLQDQLILFSFLVAEPPTTTIHPVPSDISVDGLIDEISSGRMRESYQNYINGR